MLEKEQFGICNETNFVEIQLLIKTEKVGGNTSNLRVCFGLVIFLIKKVFSGQKNENNR